MYELISNPDRYIGRRVTFGAFYAPAFGRPTFFPNREAWVLLDAPSAVSVPRMDDAFQRLENNARFSYVRASGVVGVNPVSRMEPHLSLQDASMQPISESGDLSGMQAALESEAEIGFSEEEWRRLELDRESP